MGADKMKNLAIILVLGLMLGGVACGHPADTSREAVVHYYDFGIQRITGLHEDEIDSRGCAYAISVEAFLRLLSNNNLGKYNPLDVRGHVVFATGESYYIDRSGRVRFGDKQFVIDKRAFSKLLKSTGESCDSK
jgi:hypothetical protein